MADKEFTTPSVLKALVIGAVAFVLVFIAFILLLITQIGVKLAFTLILLFIVICLVSVPVLSIMITNALKPAFKIEKTSMFYLILVLVSIILYGVTLIPYVGFIFSMLIKFIAVGMFLEMIMPKKELTAEEKLAIEETKKQEKADKEKRKQEKLEAKATKKAEKENKK